MIQAIMCFSLINTCMSHHLQYSRSSGGGLHPHYPETIYEQRLYPDMEGSTCSNALSRTHWRAAMLQLIYLSKPHLRGWQMLNPPISLLPQLYLAPSLHIRGRLRAGMCSTWAFQHTNALEMLALSWAVCRGSVAWLEGSCDFVLDRATRISP